MLPKRPFRTLAAFGAATILIVLAASAPRAAAQAKTGYVLYLKDGTRIPAREKPTRLGEKLIFKTPLGAGQSLPAAELDEKKTEEMNKLGTGTAYVLGDTPDARVPIVTPRPAGQSDLSNFVKVKGKQDLKAPDNPTFRPADVPADKLPPVPGGITKPGKAETVDTAVEPQTGDAFARAMDAAGIRGARFSPMPGGVRITAITDTEQQVFAALGGTARGLKEARAAGRPVEKVELVLATATGEAGGKFLFLPEDADSLLNGKVSAAKFFLAQVQF